MIVLGSDNLRLAKIGRLAELDDYQTSNLVMVSVVSSIPTGGQFYFLLKFFETPLCQCCSEISDLFLLWTKTSSVRDQRFYLFAVNFPCSHCSYH